VKEGEGGAVRGGSTVRCSTVHPGNIVTGVVRTLPYVVQVAYKICMSRILLTPSEGARASLYAATRGEALANTGLAPYFTSECVAKPPSPPALDDDAAAKLWDVTLATLGLPKDFKP
jgi:hypothetical protein